MDYKYRFFALRQVVCLALLSASGVSLVYEGYWGWALFVMVGVVYVIMLTLRSQRNLNEKFELMLKAFINDDFSFRFPVKGWWDYTTRHLNSLMDSYSRILDKNRRVLAERETFYKLILDHVNTGIIVVDEEDNVVQCNGKALKMLGIPALSRMKQLDRLGGYVADAFRLAVPDGQKRLSYETPKGTKEILLGVAVLKLQQGQLRIFTLNDLRAAVDERELDAWIKMSHVLTHEIMNSMTPIISLSELLTRQMEQLEGDEQDKEDMRRMLATIVRRGQSLTHFVDSYRKVSHLPQPVLEPLHVTAFLEDLIRLMQTDKDDIRLVAPVVPLAVYADKGQIEQVLINLITNAREHEATRIVLTAGLSSTDRIFLRVSDNGCGIAPEALERIFVPFFTTKSGGSGIGLALSRQIMLLHQGTIEVSSQQGAGSTFTLLFPYKGNTH